MRRFFGVVVALPMAFLVGCSSGQPEAGTEEVTEKTMESGLKSLPPGVEQDSVTQAMEEFRQTGQISPELRRKLEQQGQQMYGQQYPGAQQRPPGR